MQSFCVLEIPLLPMVICLIFILLPSEKLVLHLQLVFFYYTDFSFGFLLSLLKLENPLTTKFSTYVHNYGLWKYLWTFLPPVTSGNTSNGRNSLFLLEVMSCKTFSSVSVCKSSLHLLIKSSQFSLSLHLKYAIRFKYIDGWLHATNNRLWEEREKR